MNSMLRRGFLAPSITVRGLGSGLPLPDGLPRGRDELANPASVPGTRPVHLRGLVSLGRSEAARFAGSKGVSFRAGFRDPRAASSSLTNAVTIVHQR